MTVTTLTGDCRDILPTLPAESVQCVVTSPPYFGLRDYGADRQIGLESTVDAYVAELVAVFREVRRVLRPDGVLWLNLGSSYGDGKQLIPVPWLMALALQADAWVLRQDIIWSKPNAMPESVTDRCTKSHEYLFLLTKSARYFWDAAAIAEPAFNTNKSGTLRTSEEYGQAIRRAGGGTNNAHGGIKDFVHDGTRHRRSVWTIATQPTKDAHFATYPEALVEPCILAGTSGKGQCPACGAPWVRVVERDGYNGAGRSTDTYTAKAYTHPQSAPRGPKSNFGPGGSGVTTGWNPSCTCDAGDPVPQVILDPFAGSGTTGRVATRLGRDCILIELNPAYVDLIERRTAQRGMVLA